MEDKINIQMVHRALGSDALAYQWQFDVPMFCEPKDLENILLSQITRMVHEIKIGRVKRDCDHLAKSSVRFVKDWE